MSDFTFKDHLDGIIRFNDANVFTINFDATTEDITIKKTDDETGQTKTLTINMNQMSFVTSEQFTGVALTLQDEKGSIILNDHFDTIYEEPAEEVVEVKKTSKK